MLDDVEYGDAIHDKAMRRGSAMLAECIRRALAGEETNAPRSFAPVTILNQRPRVYSHGEIEEIRQLRARGLTSGQIAIKLKRPRKAINNIVRRYAEGGK